MSLVLQNNKIHNKPCFKAAKEMRTTKITPKALDKSRRDELR